MRKTCTVIICLILTITTNAQDRYFARTYTSNVLPKGAIDLEVWHTSRFGHSGQFYHAQEQRMELELGLGSQLQTAFYFNHYQKRFSEGADGTSTSSEIGFSNEWKLKLGKPTAKTGKAIYAEWGIKGGDEIELELKAIFDRSFGKHLLAFNAIGEYEKEFEWENNATHANAWEGRVEMNLAYLYNISMSTGIGFEFLNRNDIAKTEGWKNSTLFGGPTFNYRGKNWFVLLNYLPQWTNLHQTKYAPFTKVLDEQERTEARIILGISLK